jgi:hypothetical protein
MNYRIMTLVLAGSALLQFGCGGGGSSGGQIASCSGTFKGCGGDVTGKWSIDGICIEGDIKSLMAEEFNSEDVPPECSDIFQSVSADMSGTVEYANGNQISDVSTTMKMKIKYTSACLSAQSGTSMKMTQSLCDTLESSMNSDASSDDDSKMTTSCSFSTSCNCTITMSGQTKDTVGYTVSGSTITTDDGETAEYCVSGKNLTIRQQSEGDPAGQTKLHRI